MRKTAEVKALMEEAGMEFAPGDRVRVWYASEGKWKVATVRTVILEPCGPQILDRRCSALLTV
jgi:hypothetical protein